MAVAGVGWRRPSNCGFIGSPSVQSVDLIMKITRRYTTEGIDPFASMPFVKRTSRITNPDGTLVFELKDLLAPESWSQVAVDILAQKYFRRAGVPTRLERAAEPGVPEWIQRSVPAGRPTRIGHQH